MTVLVLSIVVHHTELVIEMIPHCLLLQIDNGQISMVCTNANYPIQKYLVIHFFKSLIYGSNHL